MVRAEKWDDRDRILNILIAGDTPCRRLFLDYRGLKLMYNWMVNLPLPIEDSLEQPITSEEFHLLVIIGDIFFCLIYTSAKTTFDKYHIRF